MDGEEERFSCTGLGYGRAASEAFVHRRLATGKGVGRGGRRRMGCYGDGDEVGGRAGLVEVVIGWYHARMLKGGSVGFEQVVVGEASGVIGGRLYFALG